MIPTVESLRFDRPEDALALACAICYGRPGLRDDETEARLIRHCLAQDPPHLTIAEHSRHVALIEDVAWDDLATLGALRGGLQMEAWRDDMLNATGRVLVSFNLSHVLQLRRRDSWLEDELGALLRPTHPITLGDREFHPEGRARLVAGRDDWSSVPDGWAVLGMDNFPAAQFRIVASRAVTHELRTHRTVSWEQRSQRYVDEGDRLNGASWDFIWPPDYPEGPRWDLSFEGCDWEPEAHYRALRGRGWTKQDARYVLPNATPSVILGTGTLEAWRHFLTLRGHRKAMHEVRYVAHLVRRHLAAAHPLAPWPEVDTFEIEGWMERAKVVG